ncbi:MAG: cysteine protease, partial [Leptospiraceae bacterium]|nr:cysteine protease [Leptospiraceae bacterium]
MKFRVLRCALIIITLVASLSVFSEELGTGLNFEPYDLYSSIPLRQANFPTSARGLPIKVDLREQLPPAGFQGKQGSCVAFATSYAVQSYYEFLSRRKFFSDWNSLKIGGFINPKTVFSPAFVHSSLTKGRDTGVTYFDALNFLTNVGSVPWERMPYDPLNFQKPDPRLNELAENYRIRGFRRVNFLNIEEIKTFLVNREPVLVGIIVYSNLQELKEHEVYSNHSGKPLGGHAVVLVGYDDEKNAFLFLNSWGSNWADSGYGWIDYNWYLKTARVGYVILGDKGEFVSGRNETAKNFPIQIGRVLEPPSEIFATQGNYSDKVILTWEKVSNALGYEIYRSFAHEDNFYKIGVSTFNQFIDDGVISDIAYAYKIVTLGDNQTSSLSNQKIIGFASKNAKDIPAKITGLKASNNLSDRIRLDWDELEFGVTGYQVFKWDIKTKTFKPLAKVQANWYEDKNA